MRGAALALCAMLCAAPLWAQEGDPLDCPALLGDVRFCADAVGLTGSVEARETVVSGTFHDPEDYDGSVVGIGMAVTRAEVPTDMEPFREAYDAGFVEDAAPYETREIVDSFSATRGGVPMLRTVRYSFNVDYGRVFAFSYFYLNGLTIEVLTIEGGVGPVFTQAHRARHEAALGALLLPTPAEGCVPVNAGLDICPEGAPWDGLAQVHVPGGVSWFDPEGRGAFVQAHAGVFADEDGGTGTEAEALHEELSFGPGSGAILLQRQEDIAEGRTWVVSDLRRDTAAGSRIGRSALSVTDGVIWSLQITWPDAQGDPLPSAHAEIHRAALARFSDRRGSGSGWVSAGLTEDQ